MTIHLINSTHAIHVRNMPTGDHIDHVIPHVYSMVFTPDGVDMIKDTASFKTPTKLYGDIEKHATRIVRDYHKRDNAMGVLLTGQRGGGKTLLARQLSNKLLSAGLPVLDIRSPIPPAILRNIIQIVGPCVLFFDEYSRTYSEVDVRETMLALFSDSEIPKVMFIITDNNVNDIGGTILLRPGRFKFHIQHAGMDLSVAEEMMKDAGMNPDVIAYMKEYITVNQVTYDVLSSVISEVYDVGTVTELLTELTILNVPKPFITKLTKLQVNTEETLRVKYGVTVSDVPDVRVVSSYNAVSPTDTIVPEGAPLCVDDYFYLLPITCRLVYPSENTDVSMHPNGSVGEYNGTADTSYPAAQYPVADLIAEFKVGHFKKTLPTGQIIEGELTREPEKATVAILREDGLSNEPEKPTYGYQGHFARIR